VKTLKLRDEVRIRQFCACVAVVHNLTIAEAQAKKEGRPTAAASEDTTAAEEALDAMAAEVTTSDGSGLKQKGGEMSEEEIAASLAEEPDDTPKIDDDNIGIGTEELDPDGTGPVSTGNDASEEITF